MKYLSIRVICVIFIFLLLTNCSNNSKSHQANIKLDSIEQTSKVPQNNALKNDNSSQSFPFLLIFTFVLLVANVYMFTELKLLNSSLHEKVVMIITESERVKKYVLFLQQKNKSTNISFQDNISKSPPKLSEAEIHNIVDRVLECIKFDNPHIFEAKKESAIIQPEPVITIESRKILYSYEPRLGNCFDMGISYQKLKDSIYYLELQDDNLARFGIIEDDEIMQRVIKYDYMLEQACEIISIVPNARRIDMIETGIAQKEDNKWIIKQKAKVKFV
ncbi:MAG: hypothetical protein NTY07_00125 [Bacteroidia bacterium]|nr:hypothetical protein [Bacteroidia bacterium]